MQDITITPRAFGFCLLAFLVFVVLYFLDGVHARHVARNVPTAELCDNTVIPANCMSAKDILTNLERMNRVDKGIFNALVGARILQPSSAGTDNQVPVE